MHYPSFEGWYFSAKWSIRGNLLRILSLIFQIIVEAVRGAHYTSDVSIDNFKFETGLCPKEAAGSDDIYVLIFLYPIKNLQYMITNYYTYT